MKIASIAFLAVAASPAVLMGSYVVGRTYDYYLNTQIEKAIRPDVERLFEKEGYKIQSLKSVWGIAEPFQLCDKIDIDYKLTPIKDDGHGHDGYATYDKASDAIDIGYTDTGIRRSSIPAQP